MTADVLILGGTGEARALAAVLVERGDRRIVSSLAGRVSAPLLPVGEVRLGGFGGPAGLRDWLAAEGVGAVVDATHPFAARISAAALAATGILDMPLVVLRRPGWQAGPGDDWHRVPDMAAAARAVAGSEGPVLLTTGRGGLEVFADLPHRFVIRTVDPPTGRLPADHVLLLSRGPYDVTGERAVLDEHGVPTAGHQGQRRRDDRGEADRGPGGVRAGGDGRPPAHAGRRAYPGQVVRRRARACRSAWLDREVAPRRA